MKTTLSLFILCFTTISLAQSNYIDTSFGINGISNIGITNLVFENQEHHGFSITESGKIVNLGLGINTSDEKITVISQYNSNGSLDMNFGTNGVLELSNFTGFDLVAVNNNLYVSGYSPITFRMGILGLDSNGNTLTNFGTNGIVTINQNIVSFGNTIKIDATNKFVVAGTGIVNSENQLAIARFSNDGNIDTSFGDNGLLTINVSSIITDEEIGNEGRFNLSFFSDNSIFIASDIELPEDGTPSGSYEYNEFAVKVTPSGTLDNSFGNNGIAIYYDITTSQADIYASYIMPNNKILLSTSGCNDNEINCSIVNRLVRLNSDGTIDTSFGTNGLLSLVNDDFEMDELFTTQLDSDILVLGSNSINEVSVLKISEDGVIDTSFANSGVLPIDFPGVSIKDLVSNALELSDGKILVSGFRENEDGFLMGRYFVEQQLSIPKETFASVQLHPNPARNYLQITSNQYIDHTQIYQLDGKLLLEQNAGASETNLFISPLKNGVYILRIFGKNDTVQTVKFVKQN